NWTGGVPVLAAALLDTLQDHTVDVATVTKNNIDSAAADAVRQYGDWLDELWDDCTAEMQDGLMDLFQGDRPASQFAGDWGGGLEQRGMPASQANRVCSGCEMLRGDATGKYAASVAGMQRLFGTAELFKENVRRLLETRRMQVVAVDPRLLSPVVKAIREL